MAKTKKSTKKKTARRAAKGTTRRNVGEAIPMEPDGAPGMAEGMKFKRSVGKATPVEPEGAPGVAEGKRETEPRGTAVVAGGETGKTAAKQPAARGPLRLTETAKRRLVSKLISLIGGRVEEDGAKASLADLIRLLQLEKELTPSRPKKITVQWVEPERKGE